MISPAARECSCLTVSDQSGGGNSSSGAMPRSSRRSICAAPGETLSVGAGRPEWRDASTSERTACVAEGRAASRRETPPEIRAREPATAWLPPRGHTVGTASHTVGEYVPAQPGHRAANVKRGCDAASTASDDDGTPVAGGSSTRPQSETTLLGGKHRVRCSISRLRESVSDSPYLQRSSSCLSSIFNPVIS